MTSRGLTIALAISAALNVFVVGAGAGVLLSRVIGPAHAGQRGRLAVAADKLGPTERTAFLEMMRDQAQGEGPVLLDAREARRQAVAALQAPRFDRAAAGAALDRARADDMAVRTKIENAVLDFAAGLSPQGRAALAAGIAPQLAAGSKKR
jgi:uncharacterized membrane protein